MAISRDRMIWWGYFCESNSWFYFVFHFFCAAGRARRAGGGGFSVVRGVAARKAKPPTAAGFEPR